MKLYTYFQSSGSYRVRIALGLKGLKAEMAFVNLVKGEQRDEAYAQVNPQRLVPALTHQGHTLTQSLAIMEYLDETHPTPPLLPREPIDRAYVRALSQIIAADTAPLGNLKVRKHLEGMGQDKEQVKSWIGHWINDGLAAFEKMLAREKRAGSFCFGDTPGMADCCLIPQLFNADRWGCDLKPYPLIVKIRTACDAHDAFIAAHPSRQADAG